MGLVGAGRTGRGHGQPRPRAARSAARRRRGDGGLGEEVGWRGLAWVRLRRRLALRDAALVVTVPWASWHLPAFWIDSGLADLPLYVLPVAVAATVSAGVITAAIVVLAADRRAGSRALNGAG